MQVTWLFEVAGNNWSTKNVTWSSIDYSAKVYPSSFSGVTMRWDISGNGLIAPNDVSFEVDGTSHNLEGYYVTIRLVVDEMEKRTWIFKVKSAIEYYGKTKCNCVDFLQDYLEGSWPNTPHPKEVWSSDDVEEEDLDDSCIPVVLGASPYIPVMSVNIGSDRYYVLGESGPTYTVNEVHSPHSWPNTSTWSASDYSMNGSVSGGYQLLQPIIADSDGDGVADAAGLWYSGDTFYDMLCLYTRDDTNGFTNPINWIEYVLEDFGVPSTYIDSTNFSNTATVLDDTLEFTGGFFEKKGREKILANLLHQIDCYLVCTDKVRIYQFEGASQATITNVLSESFSPQFLTKSSSDSGRVHWPGDYSGPQDKLTGKSVVPSHQGGTTAEPSSTTLKCRFLAGQSANAAKAGVLYFQKRLQQKDKVSFSHILTELSTVDLSPGEVITVDNALYGGARNIIITEFSVKHDLQVDITGIELYYLEDWANLTTTTKDVITDSSTGFQLASTDAEGTLQENVDWNTNLLNIPARIKDSPTVGISVTDSYLGYYDGTSFQVYVDSNGQFQFRGDTSNYINWDGTTLDLVGAMTINSGSGALNLDDGPAESGADVTGNNTASDTSNVNGIPSSNVSGWAYGSDTTFIDGGSIYTETITASQISAGTITANEISSSTITTNNLNFSVIDETNISNGQHQFSRIYDDGGSLVLDGSNLEITGNDNSPLFMSFNCDTISHYIGAGNTSDTLSFWASSDGNGDLFFGVKPDSTISKFSSIWIYTQDFRLVGESYSIFTIEDIARFQPSPSESIDLGDDSNYWNNAYILNINCTNITCGDDISTYAIKSPGANISSESDFIPAVTTTYNLGSSDYAWNTIYCSTLDDSYAANLKEYDCISILGKLDTLKDARGNEKKSHGDVPRLDKRTLPDWLTNKERLYEELEGECCGLLSRDYFEELWTEGEFAEWRSTREVFHTLDTAIGAIIQLKNRVETLEGAING